MLDQLLQMQTYQLSVVAVSLRNVIARIIMENELQCKHKEKKKEKTFIT